MTIYLVKKQHFVDNSINDALGNCEGEWQYDEVIAVCSTVEKAQEYVDIPNVDIIVTRVTLDGDMSQDEELIVNTIN